MDKAFLAAKNAMVGVTEDLMPDDDITDVMVAKVVSAYDKAKLLDADRNTLKSMLDPTANDRRLIELSVKLALRLAPHVRHNMSEHRLRVLDEVNDYQDIYLGDW